MKKTFIIPIIFLILLLSACQTTIREVPPNLSPAKLFQKAQDASENGNYKLAMEYYRTFQKRYSGNLEKNLWAYYEIAFLYHKMNKNDKAVKLFNELLNKYATQGTKEWPQAPRILAEKVKAGILKKENKQKQ